MKRLLFIILFTGPAVVVQAQKAFIPEIGVVQSIENDSLVFDNKVSDRHFLFRRDKEMRNGQLVPKQGAGFYEFKLKPETISLYNTISSCYCFNDYFFSRDGATITLGNFYDTNMTGDLRTFRKLP